MRRIIISSLVVLWWTWLLVQVVSSGSAQVALELRSRFWEAAQRSGLFGASLYHSGLLFADAASAWSEIFAPFVIDLLGFVRQVLLPQLIRLVDFLFPIILRGVEVASPWVAAAGNRVGISFMNQSFEVQASLIWIPTVLALARLDRRALNGLVMPAAWTSWRIFGPIIGNSRKPLLVAGVVIPAILSFRVFAEKKTSSTRRLLSLNSYWTLFPGFVFLENALSLNSSFYVSTLTVATLWLLFNDAFTFVLDAVYGLSWKLLGDEVLAVAAKLTSLAQNINKQYGGTYRSVAFMSGLLEKARKFQDLKNSYKIAVVVITGAALVYWAFAVMNKIFALAVWPWFFWEMAKVCVHRSDAFYRNSLAFALFFISLEYLVLPSAPFFVRAFVSVFHLPIVFLGKMSAEVVLDLALRRSVALTRALLSRRQSPTDDPPKSIKSE